MEVEVLTASCQKHFLSAGILSLSFVGDRAAVDANRVSFVSVSGRWSVVHPGHRTTTSRLVSSFLTSPVLYQPHISQYLTIFCSSSRCVLGLDVSVEWVASTETIVCVMRIS